MAAEADRASDTDHMEPQTNICRQTGMRRADQARSGQAIVELVVALVVVLVLTAGLVQLGSLGYQHTQAMTEARRQAAVLAMQPQPPFSGPHYIRNRTVGPDGSPYSRDDDYQAAFPATFNARVVQYAHPDRLQEVVSGNAFSELGSAQFPVDEFGLVRGRAATNVPLLPVVRRLIYAADKIEVQAEAWLTWTTGIY